LTLLFQSTNFILKLGLVLAQLICEWAIFRKVLMLLEMWFQLI